MLIQQLVGTRPQADGIDITNPLQLACEAGRRKPWIGGVVVAAEPKQSIGPAACIPGHNFDQVFAALYDQIAHDQRLLEQAHGRDRLQHVLPLVNDRNRSASNAASMHSKQG